MKIINNDWEFTSVWSEDFLHGGPAEKKVRIPHTVREMPLHYADPEDYQMVCGYRKTIRIPSEEKGKRHFLQFDGAAHIATLYFNGKELLTHKNGYTGFRAEISDLVKYDEDNFITVKLDTTENPSVPPFGFVIDYLTFGGIYRNVYLDTRPQKYISDVFVQTPNLHLAKVTWKCEGAEKNDILLASIEKDGKVLAECAAKVNDGCMNLNVAEALAWSPEHPNLYTLHLTLKGSDPDQVSVRFGFRTVSTNENSILLNGKPYFIRGLNRHQCYPYSGYAVPDSLQKEDARILKEELGVNAVRTSHYPQSHAFLDACDELGLLVFTEIPGWQHLGDEAWKKQAVENTKEMVLQYRNHVSIFLWGVRINELLDDDELYKETNRVAHELDPSRPTSGVRYLEKSSLLEDVYGYNDFSHDGSTPGAKAKKDVTSEKKPLIITEANGHMFPTRSSDRWERRQEHALRHARVLDAAMSDKEHAGCFQWCMFDYPTHKDFGSGDRICYHGVMDYFRNPKLAASLYASQSEDHPVLEISSSMDIGDYDGGHLDTVWAFTNADEVRLYKNDEFVKSFKPQGWKGLKHGPVKIDDTIGELLHSKEGFTGTKEKLIHDAMLAAQKYGMAGLPKKDLLKLGWVMLHYKMKYSEGVELYGKYVGGWGGGSTSWRFDAVKDGKVVQSVTKSPRTKLHLDVKTSSTELQEGDVYDMAAIRIQLKDDLNNLASYAAIPVSFSVSGPVELVGPACLSLEGGMGGTYLRTTGEAGKASVTIASAQTDPVTINFEIRKG
jgi:beta-galactosidase